MNPMTNSYKTTAQSIALLGATGSIGQSTLDIIRLHLDKYRLFAVSGFANWQKLLDICQEFNPAFAIIGDACFDVFNDKINALNLPIQVLKISDGLDFVASHRQVDTVVCAIVGSAGLSSTYQAVKAGKKVLLANKESLVMAGDLIMQTAKQNHATILPIDSEHNAIFQCLPKAVQNDNSLINQDNFGIKRLWLTASGGAFLHKSFEQMKHASVAQAIKHPNWSMGQKISVDSATMMNKGLEVIEACHLFGVGVDSVGVVIHPQSVVHSLVEYVDGSMLAQCGTPDMKTPIGYALAYPDRLANGVSLNLFEMNDLQFIKPDEQKFACLALAKQAMRLGNGACIVLNGANEVAVDAFLKQKIKLTDISQVVQNCLNADELANELPKSFDNLADILVLDERAKTLARKLIDDENG